MRKYYAGIGSRETPGPILERMTNFGRRLHDLGYILRSGGAEGADTAFEDGEGEKVILKADDATLQAIEVARAYHPAWEKCNWHAKKLHGRNAMIILGDDINDEDMWVKFVLCWTPPDVPYGGTKLGMRIAKDFGIPVFNLALEGMVDLFDMYLSALEI